MAEREFFCNSCIREGVPRVLIVLTDGNTNPGSEDLGVVTKGMKVRAKAIVSV